MPKKKSSKKRPPNKKGVAGYKTGGSARKKIRALDSCMTQKQIGRRIGRSASVVGAIKSGEIKNPPKHVVTRLNKIPTCKK